jgi:hypothetical protein
VITLESIAREDVEDAVGSVPDIGLVSAALSLHLIDVFGVDLGSDVRGYFGIRYGNAIDEPACLVAATDVQHVVAHIGSGHEVGDHLHAQCSCGARSVVDIRARNERGRRCGFHLRG